MVIEYENFEEGIKLAGFYDVDPNLLVIVSDAKELQKEWRFVIVDQEVISGSLYRDWTIGLFLYRVSNWHGLKVEI